MTENHLAFFQDKDYCIVQDGYTEWECEELIVALEELDAFKDGTLTPVTNPHKLDIQFLHAMRNPILLDMMHRLFPGDIS